MFGIVQIHCPGPTRGPPTRGPPGTTRRQPGAIRDPTGAHPRATPHKAHRGPRNKIGPGNKGPGIRLGLGTKVEPGNTFEIPGPSSSRRSTRLLKMVSKNPFYGYEMEPKQLKIFKIW